MAAMSIESELLLLLSRQNLTEPQLARVREILDQESLGLDWGRFAAQAARHRVAALVGWQWWRLMTEEAVMGMDAAVMMLLYSTYRDTRRGNALLLHEIKAISEAAAEQGTTVLMRKGGHLAFTAYQEPGTRPMGDLDVLVTREQAPDLVRVLERLGYVEGKPTAAGIVPLSKRERAFWRLYGSDLPKLNKLTGELELPVISIDVNVSLALPGKGYDIPVDAVLAHARSHRYADASFLVPSAEDAVIDLAAHIHKTSTTLRFMNRGGKHRRLIKYVDIAELVRSAGPDLSWDLLLKRVDEYAVAGPVFYGLAHLDKLFPNVVPAETLAALRQRCPEPDLLLQQYGQWDFPEPRVWQEDFLTRFFDPESDRDLPVSKSLV
ncbi:nucleotidyltransferase family protein [Micromonospora sp. NPDC049060]|uniref:nucleotidyltransferase domain-containing protein n=1 Tax=unclassified Micromonospora TaxID=2617518 RepID=UPI0033D468CF